VNRIGILARTGLIVLVTVVIQACVTASLPPVHPQPITSFDVKFVPVNNERYSPTNVTDVKRYKNILRSPGLKDLIRGDENPIRPYKIIGKMYLGENWYYSKNIKELIDKHVPLVGGDAVLTYEAMQTKSAIVKDSETGQFVNAYYQSITLEVIRYTER